MRFLPFLLILLALPADAAETWLVYRDGETRSRFTWHGPKPEAKNLPPGAIVIAAPKGMKRSADYLRTGLSIQLKPEDLTRPLSANAKAAIDARKQAEAKLKEAAADKSISDAKYLELKAKVERAKDIDDLAKRKEKLDEVTK